jgi:pimeloyl-ACP methyl ester carboxylesterase
MNISQNSKLILFIHGLGGSSSDTWGNFPELIKSSSELKGYYDVDFFDYPSVLFRFPFTKQIPIIQRIAQGLKSQIDNASEHYKEITLLCHSLGGLIGRYYVLQEARANRFPLLVKNLILFSVPNEGTELARIGKMISWRYWLLHQLTKDSDFLIFLNDEWESLKMENKVRVKYVIAGLDLMVSESSAISKWGKQKCEWVINRGHRDVVKPIDNKDLSFRIVSRFLKQEDPVLSGRVHPNHENDFLEFIIIFDFIVTQIKNIHREKTIVDIRRIMKLIENLHQDMKERLISLAPYLPASLKETLDELIDTIIPKYLLDAEEIIQIKLKRKAVVKKEEIRILQDKIQFIHENLMKLVIQDNIMQVNYKNIRKDEQNFWGILGFNSSIDFRETIYPDTKTMVKNADIIQKKLLVYILEHSTIKMSELLEMGYYEEMAADVFNSLMRDKLLRTENNEDFCLSPIGKSILLDLLPQKNIKKDKKGEI